KYDIPFRTQFKLSGSYTMPWDVAFAAVFQSVPGLERQITYVVSRAQVPQLTVSSVTVPLNDPGSLYYPRRNQLDLKFSKVLQAGGVRVTPQLDIFNVTNTATVLQQINAIGQPHLIQDLRQRISREREEVELWDWSIRHRGVLGGCGKKCQCEFWTI